MIWKNEHCEQDETVIKCARESKGVCSPARETRRLGIQPSDGRRLFEHDLMAEPEEVK